MKSLKFTKKALLCSKFFKNIFMKKFIAILSLLFLFVGNVFSVSAQTDSALKIMNVQAKFADQIDIGFNQEVDTSTLRVTIENTLLHTFVIVSNYEPKLDDAKTISIKLGENLQSSATYKLTINSAISTSGQTISAGIDAIREFVTPDKFTSRDTASSTAITSTTKTDLNASTGTSAPISKTDSQTTISTGNTTSSSLSQTPSKTGATTSTVTDTKSASGSSALKSSEVKELPTTGSEAIILLVFSIILASFIIFARSRKA